MDYLLHRAYYLSCKVIISVLAGAYRTKRASAVQGLEKAMEKEAFVVPISWPKFKLGAVVMTRGVIELVEKHSLNPQFYIWLHENCVWSDMTEEDQESNQQALEHGLRIFSSYLLGEEFPEDKIWVITEHNRSVTTLLLPHE